MYQKRNQSINGSQIHVNMQIFLPECRISIYYIKMPAHVCKPCTQSPRVLDDERQPAGPSYWLCVPGVLPRAHGRADKTSRNAAWPAFWLVCINETNL
jgi:hypothetical protein